MDIIFSLINLRPLAYISQRFHVICFSLSVEAWRPGVFEFQL